MLVALFAVAWLLVIADRALSSDQPLDARLIEMIARHVERYGWEAEMGRMCRAFELAAPGNCKFKQIAVSDAPPDTLDTHGFNVRLTGANAPTDFVIFHLTRPRGHFFVVSRTGKLHASFMRAPGIDYAPMSLAEGQVAFATALEFWRTNLQKVQALQNEGP